MDNETREDEIIELIDIAEETVNDLIEVDQDKLDVKGKMAFFSLAMKAGTLALRLRSLNESESPITQEEKSQIYAYREKVDKFIENMGQNG